MLLRSLFLLAGALFLCACGLGEKFERIDAGSTTVNFQFDNTRTTLGGGIMIYAVNIDDPKRRGAILISDETNPRSWRLPSATYRFFAVGYTAANLAGAIYCAASSNIELSGEPRVVGLNLARATCTASDFVPANFVNTSPTDQPLNLLLVSCSTITDVTTKAAAANCSGGGEPGPLVSFKVSLPEFEGFSGIPHVGMGQSIESACVTATAGAHVTTSVLVPTGSGHDSPFVLGINGFTDGTCSSSIRKRYGFIRGLYNTDPASALLATINAGAETPTTSSLQNIHTVANTSWLFVFLRDF